MHSDPHSLTAAFHCFTPNALPSPSECLQRWIWFRDYGNSLIPAELALLALALSIPVEPQPLARFLKRMFHVKRAPGSS